MRQDRVDVIVVGAGPSGLFSAVELARHGIRARVLERLPEPHHQARATAMQPGTLEILERCGVLDQVLAASERVDYARVLDAALDVVAEIAFAGTGCRWEFQASLPQYETERIFTDRLTTLGGEVERGVTVSGLESHDHGVLVKVEYLDGTRETFETGWVIGAGGAHSVTRGSMDQVLVGETYPGTALVADITLDCGVPRDGGALVATPRGYVLLAPLPGERWITFIGDLQADEAELLGGDQSPAAIEAAIRGRVRADVRLQDVAWSSLFQMHRRLAPRLAGQRRFLLGDAGHLSSPFGGEGMNSGLHDGHNLAWKLALVIRGRAPDSLLESFAVERESADRHVLEVSDQLHQLAHDAVRAAETGTTAPAPSDDQVRALTRSRSMLDVTYADSPLVGEHRAGEAGTGDGLRLGERHPDLAGLDTEHLLFISGAADADAAERLRQRWRGLVDITEAGGGRAPDGGLVLVRPDGYVGFRSPASDAAALEALDAHLASYLIPA